jgi:polyisoprenyl-phosphate glycosyltransferase
VIDADLQDPPELIASMVDAWREGHDVVTMRRETRAGETFLKRASAGVFYRLLNRVSDVPIPLDTGDFRLLSRRAVNALRQMPERNRYMKGMFAWIGFPQKELRYARDARLAGRSQWSYPRLLGLALDGVTAFTWVPLRFATYAGLLAAVAALSFGIWIVAKTLIYGDPVAGYPSMMTVILFLGGVQLLAIGIQGEYLGRLFNESKQRPLYLVQSAQPARDRRELAGTESA